jgi:hypothetical protein
MLQKIYSVSDEQIERSKEIVKALDEEKDPKKVGELKAELERLTRKVRQDIIEEGMDDFNNQLPKKAPKQGTFLKERNEEYFKLVYWSEKVDRWGWAKETINGKQMMYNPRIPEDERKYEPVPQIQKPQYKTMYLVKTNRAQIKKIEDLLERIIERCRHELTYAPIDQIINEREAVVSQISKIDVNEMIQEWMEQGEFDEATYIKNKPQRPYEGVE